MFKAREGLYSFMGNDNDSDGNDNNDDGKNDNDDYIHHPPSL